MSLVLVDSSVWISFFKGEANALPMMDLIDSNRVCTNDLLLSELVPSLNHKKEQGISDLLYSVINLDLKINWEDIIQMQTINLMNGINRVGIPDLIILQNSVQNGVPLFSFDKHFGLMKDLHRLELYQN